MTLKRIEVSSVRNIRSAALSFSPAINILYGSNGSGKTSVLESLCLLGLGRSFRTTKMNSLITHGEDMSTVFGVVDAGDGVAVPMGVTRYRGGKRDIQIAGSFQRKSSRLAELLPLQIMTPESVQFLSGPPSRRRQFMNWGVFHVKHTFQRAWQVAEHSLKQRNALLRHAKIDLGMLEVWTRQLAESAQTIDAFRYEYFESFIPHFKNLLAELLDVGDIELIYYPGWDRKRSLQDALEGVIRKDKERGFTSLGHHRADMIIKVAGVSATEVLSRGEQKLVASALMLTQGQLLRKLAEKKCTYLVDDLASELDPVHRKRLCGLLERIDCQVVITAVDEMALAPFWTTDNNKLFHVKHGKVTPQEVL